MMNDDDDDDDVQQQRNETLDCTVNKARVDRLHQLLLCLLCICKTSNDKNRSKDGRTVDKESEEE